MIIILLNSFASGMCPEMTLWGWLRAAERFCFWPRNDFVHFSESKKHFLVKSKTIFSTESLEWSDTIISSGCWDPWAASRWLGDLPLPLKVDDEGGENWRGPSLASGLWLLVTKHFQPRRERFLVLMALSAKVSEWEPRSRHGQCVHAGGQVHQGELLPSGGATWGWWWWWWCW